MSWKTLASVLIALAAFRKPRLPRKASLEGLPVEIVLRIQHFLPQSGAIALSHTSQRFHRLPSKVLVEDLFDRYPSASESPERLADQTLYKELLARQKINRPSISNSRLLRRHLDDAFTPMTYCHGCRKLEPSADFSPAAPSNSRSLRRCRRWEGLLYSCPWRIMTLDEATTLCHNYNLNRPGIHEKVDGLCGCKQHFTTILELGYGQAAHIYNAFPICLLKGAAYHIEVLDTLRVRICPHTSISDVRVRKSLHAYLQDANKDMLYDQRYDTVKHRCKKCLTRFHFWCPDA